MQRHKPASSFFAPRFLPNPTQGRGLIDGPLLEARPYFFLPFSFLLPGLTPVSKPTTTQPQPRIASSILAEKNPENGIRRAGKKRGARVETHHPSPPINPLQYTPASVSGVSNPGLLPPATWPAPRLAPAGSPFRPPSASCSRSSP